MRSSQSKSSGFMSVLERLNSHRIPFKFNVEEPLADFVWRWIRMTEAAIIDWVDQAVKQDQFAVRTESRDQTPTEDQRHSVSVIDVFSSFNQTIDRIVQLNWADEFQYAKFMTALSKVIGIGIARYCEVLEQKFSKEMDRLTPEQEAAANQSKQERWLQLAKDAWNNKEKIEPFQFFPEVLLRFHPISASAYCHHSLSSSSTTLISRLFSSIDWKRRPTRTHALRSSKDTPLQ